jgi:transposase
MLTVFWDKPLISKFMSTFNDQGKGNSLGPGIRIFSEELKRKKVEEIERKLSSIAEVCREYQVSRAAVYKWIYRYSGMRKKGIKQVIESESDTKKIQALKEQIKELQRVIGEKQVKLDFQDKMIELAEDQYKVDIKKKFSGKASPGTGESESSTK